LYLLSVSPLQDGRVVFMLPFQGAVIAGTTDEPCPLTDRPRAHAEEVAFILDAISDFLNIKVCVRVETGT
jgi:glycerol-3-phosphate dehydrogenase